MEATGHRRARPPAAPLARLAGSLRDQGGFMSGGFVSLVGAGPGDPELLTLRAAARLRDADLVLYDALADREALNLAPRARWFYVGKRARRRSIAQDAIERLMIRAARRGERVVRLKCGADHEPLD